LPYKETECHVDAEALKKNCRFDPIFCPNSGQTKGKTGSRCDRTSVSNRFQLLPPHPTPDGRTVAPGRLEKKRRGKKTRTRRRSMFDTC